MNKHSSVTHISPLPSYVSRESVLSILHNHSTIITLNPLVTHHRRCDTPPHALPDELESAWYEITDKIEYIPGTGIGGHVTYTACMHDIPKGLQTHIHAPAGLEIRGKWQILGWLPWEKEEKQRRETFEISAEQHKIPKEGLYLREDCDLKCNFFLLPIVKRNIQKGHKQLVDKLVETAGQMALRKSLHVVSNSQGDHHPRVSTSSVGSSLSRRRHRHQISTSTPVQQHRAETPDLYPPSNQYAPTQFNEVRQREALEFQTNSYSVSVTGGKQHEESSEYSSFMRRGRSQSPGYSFVKTSLVGSSYKRYTSEGPSASGRARRNESPPSSTSSRGVSLGRSGSWGKKKGKRRRMGRETPDYL